MDQKGSLNHYQKALYYQAFGNPILQWRQNGFGTQKSPNIEPRSKVLKWHLRDSSKRRINEINKSERARILVTSTARISRMQNITFNKPKCNNMNI